MGRSSCISLDLFEMRSRLFSFSIAADPACPFCHFPPSLFTGCRQPPLPILNPLDSRVLEFFLKRDLNPLSDLPGVLSRAAGMAFLPPYRDSHGVACSVKEVIIIFFHVALRVPDF